MKRLTDRVRRTGLLLLLALVVSACGDFSVQVQPQDSAAASQAADTTGTQPDLEATNAALRATVTALEAAQSAAQSPQASAPATSDAAAEPTATTAAGAEPTAAASAAAVAPTASSEAPPAFVSAEAVALPSTSVEVAPATQTIPTLLVLDASGSMLQDDGSGGRRIDTAKRALSALVDALPEGAPVGLRVYGHRFPNTDKANGCQDSELISPVGVVDKAALKGKIDSFQATGWTPIALSLEQGAADLPPEGTRSIVLVSDGEETCDRDPCQVAAQLKQQGIDLVVNTVGFQVDQAARTQLECIAQATGGEYRDVQNADDLGEQLKQVTIPPLPVGATVSGGLTFESATLVQPGLYGSTIKQGETRFYAFDVAEGQRLLASASLIGQPDKIEQYTGYTFSSEAIFTVYDFERAGIELPNGDTDIKHGEQYLAAVGTTFGLATAADEPLKPGRYYVALALRDREQHLNGLEFQTEIGIRLESVNGPAGGIAAAPGPNPGGLSFDSAPLVQSGNYTGSIRSGETRFFAIDVANDQQLRASATVLGQPDVRPAYDGNYTFAVTLEFAVYDPQRVQVELPEGVASLRSPQYALTSNESFGVDLGPMSAGGELEPGRYYIALTLRDADDVITGREFQTEYGFELLGQ